jgi:glycosyltransferase involved in cell wall biosynthesis
MIEAKEVVFNPLIQLMKPLGFIDYNKLQVSSKAVLSDSGTISEESSILKFRALNIRQAHERPEAMEEASVMMVGLKKERILQALEVLETQEKDTLRLVSDYSMPNVSDKVLRIILSYTDYVNRVVWGRMNKKVLIMADYYIPSVKGGGPIQSIKNIVDNLSDNFDFYIVASDRDLGDDKPFQNIEVNKWGKVGRAEVFYVDPSKLTSLMIEQIIKSVNFDVMYLNSFFSFKFSILPILLMKLSRIKKIPIVMAPRGQFSPGALNLKRRKKHLYIDLSKALNFYRNILWHATAVSEKRQIEEIFGNKIRIKVANNLTGNYKELLYEKNIEKQKGELKIVFISRIHPKKNLKKAIEFLKNIEGEIEFNIFGPIEDRIYWSECENVMNDLPDNIKISYRGAVAHNEIIGIFNEHHVFLFPTFGENFGHVISEALVGGCPIIISDQTPWRELEKKQIGWDIKLTDENKFIEAIQYFTDLDSNEYNVLSKNAFQYGKKFSNLEEDIKGTCSLFNFQDI